MMHKIYTLNTGLWISRPHMLQYILNITRFQQVQSIHSFNKNSRWNGGQWIFDKLNAMLCICFMWFCMLFVTRYIIYASRVFVRLLFVIYMSRIKEDTNMAIHTLVYFCEGILLISIVHFSFYFVSVIPKWFDLIWFFFTSAILKTKTKWNWFITLI